MSGFLRPLAILLCAAVLLAGAGCGKSTSPGDTASGAPLKVVVAFYPLQFVAERVAGARAEITSLTQPGAEPHDLELTPRQIAQIADADVVLYQKGFQAAVDEAVTQAQPRHLVDAASLVTMHEATEDDGHDHGSESAEEHAGHAMDPHIWLDPTNMATIGTAVAREFGVARPDAAAEFTANAQTLADDMTALDTEFQMGLKTCERREFITSHAAFGYLAERYQLVQIGISGLDPEAEPSPARIAEIHADAEKYGVTTIFYETLVSPAVARSIADDLKLKTAVLDPVEGITDQSAGDDYSAVMRANLAALEKANACT